jgi:penicillin-binding protein 2
MLIFDQLKRSDRHLQVLAVGVLAGMGILLSGLWYLQVISAKRYRADVQGQSFRTVRVPAIRGQILDRNRQPLADNRPSYNVNLYLEELRRNFYFHYTNEVKRAFIEANPNVKLTDGIKNDLQRQARYQVVSNYAVQVSSIIQEQRPLLEKDEKEFHKHYDSRRSLPLPLLKDLSFKQVCMFAEKTPSISSLALDTQPLRIYRNNSTAAHLLGHLRRDDIPTNGVDFDFQFYLPDYRGVTGIEGAFERELRGKPGAKLVLVNSMQYRQSEEMWAQPEPGNNVILTIDLAIQQAAEKALNSTIVENVRGAAVVMDCQNGDLLALASVPTFDPNEFMSPISPDRMATLNDEKQIPMFNRAVYGLYQPGSIFKIITGLACLEAGLDPEQIYESKAGFRLTPRGHLWRDTAPTGSYTFRRAFYLSSNTYFIDYGLKKAGAKRIVEMGQRFGLGVRTGISEGLEAKGYFPDHENLKKRDGNRWRDGDTCNLSIGQGELKVTPLQMAVMTAAIANGGKLLKPRLIMRIEPQDPAAENALKEFPAGQIRDEVKLDPQHLNLIRQSMLDDVEAYDEGARRWATGHNAKVKGMSVCGKTGTAQVFDEHNEFIEWTTWFVSYAPFESPRYAVVVIIEGGGSGGGTCAPPTRMIYEALLKREQQAPAKTENLPQKAGVSAKPKAMAAAHNSPYISE